MNVSIAQEDFWAFEDWRRVRSLSRGDAIAALGRLAAGSGQIAAVGELASHGVTAPSSSTVTIEGPFRERVVDPVDRWEP